MEQGKACNARIRTCQATKATANIQELDVAVTLRVNFHTSHTRNRTVHAPSDTPDQSLGRIFCFERGVVYRPIHISWMIRAAGRHSNT